MRLSVSSLVALALLAAGAARASGPLVFQHGGLGTAEVGALTARADTAGAMSYNPAAIAHLPAGGSYHLGLDFTAPIDEYKSSHQGTFEADHLITEAPAIYAAWHLPKDYYPWAFGLGIDSVADYQVVWSPALFPGRYIANRQRIDLLAAHPVIAYELGPHWSIGAGARYYWGKLESGSVASVHALGTANQPYTVDVTRAGGADVDGYGFDAGVHYQANAWGWGAAFDTGGKVSGSGGLGYSWAREIGADPVLQANLERAFASGSVSQRWDVPAQARTGIYFGAKPGWRLEVDAAWTQYSKIDSTSVTYDPNPFAVANGLPPGTTTETTARDWKDTLSWRVGLEGDMSRHWVIGLGVALEPSPIPADRVDPGFPRGGDATVYGLGFGYRIQRVTFDISYSYYQYGNARVQGQEAGFPGASGAYATKDQAFALSASWHP